MRVAGYGSWQIRAEGTGRPAGVGLQDGGGLVGKGAGSGGWRVGGTNMGRGRSGGELEGGKGAGFGGWRGGGTGMGPGGSRGVPGGGKETGTGTGGMRDVLREQVGCWGGGGGGEGPWWSRAVADGMGNGLGGRRDAGTRPEETGRVLREGGGDGMGPGGAGQW